ncbi:2,3-bisphosphoglycerate-dependent phosphoglycerate mutase [uncultured archaeon]|nr:2,3-bisphosphoglycerate-dependent phosphoglycerate mutase [uncultured archaeon]
MEIIIARHGETTENKKKHLSGNSNTAQLTEEGKKHAQVLKSFFRDLDLVISSPLDRAMETAKPVAEKFGLNVVSDDLLREFDFGDLDGKSEEGEAKEDLFRRREDLNFKFPKGESYNDVLARVDLFLKSLLPKKHKKVLIVSHAGVCRALLVRLTKEGKQKIKDMDKIRSSNSRLYLVNSVSGSCSWIDPFTRQKGKGLLWREDV